MGKNIFSDFVLESLKEGDHLTDLGIDEDSIYFKETECVNYICVV
jgi:hypothetical protein